MVSLGWEVCRQSWWRHSEPQTRWRICVTMTMLWQQQDGGYMLLWKRYGNNKMATMRIMSLILHLQQYSHRLNLLYYPKFFFKDFPQNCTSSSPHKTRIHPWLSGTNILLYVLDRVGHHHGRTFDVSRDILEISPMGEKFPRHIQRLFRQLTSQSLSDTSIHLLL